MMRPALLIVFRLDFGSHFSVKKVFVALPDFFTITFFTLLSIVPVLLLAISVLGLVLGAVDQSKSFVLNFMFNFTND